MSELSERFCSMGQYLAMLMIHNPAMKLFEARMRSRATKRVKFSRHKPHYGKQAASRNLRHAKAGTHGLAMPVRGTIAFSNRI